MNVASAGKSALGYQPIGTAAGAGDRVVKAHGDPLVESVHLRRRRNDKLRIAFASHDVLVKGTGLDPLLAAITSHQVASIHESVRSARFPSPAARFIREIVVRKLDVD